MGVVLNWPERVRCWPLTQIDQRVGNNLRTLRRSKKLSLRELAGRFNHTVEDVLAIEAGALRVSAKDMFKMAAVFDTPVSIFYRFDHIQFRLIAMPACGRRAVLTHHLGTPAGNRGVAAADH